MKKLLFSITLMIAGLSQAQVIISEQADPVPTNSSVLLEFGTQPKGIILPSVSSAPGAVAGTFIVNTTNKAVQYFDGTNWISLTYPNELVENTFVNDGTVDAGEGVVIGAESSTKPGVLVLESTTQAMVLPRVADPHLNVLSPVAGTMVYDTTSDALAVYDGVEWSYWAAELDASGILPPNITLSQNRRHWIASVFDADYLPYTVPASAASTSVVNADGTPDAVTVDVQGSITETGITVQIPVASVTGSGNILAWTSTFVVPAMYAEDGQSRTLELSWAAQSYTTTSKFITATIKSLGGTFNAKKLDINAGIGNDYLGLLLGAFQYPYNNAGAITSYEVRDIPGIPDRMFGLLDNTPAAGQKHNFLYLPVQGADGNIWLNNNLGANYSNINHAQFNLVQQATSISDRNAFGSMFQWGRYSDGHELMSWNATGESSGLYSAVSTRANTLTPNHSNLIYTPNNGNPVFDWNTVGNTTTLWQGENGINNPCPYGFKVPANTDFSTLMSAGNISTSTDAYNSPLKFTATGTRYAGGQANTSHTVNRTTSAGNASMGYDYHTATLRSSDPVNYSLRVQNSNGSNTINISVNNVGFRTGARPVRCMKN